MTLESLKALQTRIREATGPDRGLDYAIAKTFNHWRDDRVCEQVFAHYYTLYPDGLGACVALQREVLPGWRFDIRQLHEDDFQARVHRRALRRRDGDDVFASHRVATAALLLAICAAKIAELEAMEQVDA